MPKAILRTFTDPYDYEDSIRTANVTGFTANARGDFRAELLQIDLHRLWIDAGKESLSRSFYANLSGARSPIFFLAEDNQAEMRKGGHEMAVGEILFYGRENSHYSTTSSGAQWATMSLSPTHLAEAGLALVGRELSVPDSTRVLRPRPNCMARLRQLHSAASHLAATAPEIIAHPDVARAIEQALIPAMIDCLVDGDDVELGSGYRHHATVMTRLEEWLAANGNRPAYLPEVCSALKISRRTLYRCFQQQLGMSATRYFWLRRMHLTHQALLRANPAETTVTAIAMEHGFWELGRFSVGYRALFGETPRTTLQNQFRPSSSLAGSAFLPE